MATAALNGSGQAWNGDGTPRLIRDVIAVDAAEVDASDRLRPIDMNWVVGLGQVMLAEGQRTPIEVCRSKNGKPWRLVSGGHRHAAAQLYLDLNPLQAIEVPAHELNVRRAEVSENLWRRELNPLDRATFVAELHDLMRADAGVASLSPQQTAANARWKKDLREAAKDASATIAHAYGFSSVLADQIGLSRRTIENDLMLARRLLPSVVAMLRSHPVAANATQLRALARLDGAEQSAIADRLLAGARSVAEAQAMIAMRPTPSAEDRRLSAFLGAFARMTLSERKGALAQLASLMPAPFKLVERDA